MDKIYKITLHGLLLLITLAFTACRDEEIREEGEGTLALSVALDSRTDIVIPTRSAAAAWDYTVEIKNSDNKVVRRYLHPEDIPAEIWLPAGEYTAAAYSGKNPKAAFSAPYYYGEQPITITTENVSQAAVTCTLANAKVTVSYSDRVKNAFSSFLTTVNSGDNAKLTYTLDTIAAGYFQVEKDSIALTWKVSAINKAGQNFSLENTFRAKKKYHYNLQFDLKAAEGSSEGGLQFNVAVKEDTRTPQDTVINIPLKKRPEIKGVGFDIESPFVVMLGTSKQLEIDLIGKPAITSIVMMPDRKYLNATNPDIPDNIPIMTISENAKNALNTIGIKWNTPITDSTRFDLTEITDKLERGSYTFKFEVTDNTGKSSVRSLNIAVVDADVVTIECTPFVDIWGKKAILHGQWIGAGTPANIAFQWKEATQTEWQTTTAVITPDANMNFTYELKGLKDGTKYNYRAASNGVPGNEFTLTTETIQQVPNLNFEEWAQDGKTWYPNKEKGYAYWATGNEGVTSTLAGGKNSNTTPVEGAEAVSGKAAKLVSIDGVSLVGVAAGNLFTGTYATDANNKENSVKFGRTHTGARPTQLKGWYRYQSKPISHKGDPADLAMDLCHIYIWVKDKDGNQIGYGELSNDREMSTYEEFTINVVYSNNKVAPAQISIVATSSKYGGKFESGLTGGVIGAVGAGSTLWLDELELVYE